MEVTKENFPNLNAKQREAKQVLEDAAELLRAKMREIAPRRCIECREWFTPTKSWQKFCIPSHRMKHWNDQNNPIEKQTNEEEI